VAATAEVAREAPTRAAAVRAQSARIASS
jgi:hypothetical protein